MSDETKIERVSLTDLEHYAQRLERGGRLAEANDAMVLTHLIASLRANAERDLLMAEMSKRFDALESTYRENALLHSEAYRALVAEFEALKQQQMRLHERQDIIAAVIDAGINKISEVAKKIDLLSEESTQP